MASHPPVPPAEPNSAARSPLPERARTLAGLPHSIWVLGLVSFFMDVSTEMIESLMPVFLVTVLGLGAVSVGLVSGMAEATASLTKLFSGWLSDAIGRRKVLALIGYGIATAAKPFFAPATSLAWVMAVRFVDRIGKGIRVAPRDALLADLAPEGKRGAAFGLRKALDSLGATLGPLIALLLMAAFDDDIRTVYWFAVIPAVLCLVLLVTGVREPPRRHRPAEEAELPRRERLGGLGPGFIGFVAIAGAMQLAIFSEAFMLLRGAELGLAVGLVPALLIVMNLVYAATAYGTGRAADRRHARGEGRSRILYAGFAPLIAAYALLAVADAPWACFVAAALWGVYLGMTQGLMPAIVADLAPAARRGTAFGLYHLVVGLAALPAGAIAGLLWQFVGPEATFSFGACLSALALPVFALWHGRHGKI